MTKFEEMVEWAKGGVENVVKAFEKPDDDVMPTLLMRCPAGAFVVPLRGDKHELPGLLRALFLRYRPRFAALVLSAWSASLDAKVEEERALLALVFTGATSVRALPEQYRKEIVMVEASDGTALRNLCAQLNRSPDLPPALGPWEELDQEKAKGGRLQGVVRDALQGVRK